MDDDDDEAEMRGLRMSAAADADVSCSHLTVPAIGITVTVSPPSPDCSPAYQPPHDDRLGGLYCPRLSANNINRLIDTGNNSATSNNTKLVHWPSFTYWTAS